MEQGLLGDDPRVRRTSAGNLLEDPDDPAHQRVPVRRGSTPRNPVRRPPGAPPGAVEYRVGIEDALEHLGGFGYYQVQCCLTMVLFWCLNTGTPISVFVNSPWCVAKGEPLLCRQGDDEVLKSPDVFWSDCRSVSCQFNLRPALCLGALDGDGAACALNAEQDGCEVETGDCSFTPESNTYLRPLFDSLFFLGWMWSVPLFGWLADYKGRRWALFGSWAILMLSTVACALATTPTMYLVARHFNGVGWGSQSLSAYILGTEVAPRSTATAVKTYWGAVSSIGQVAVALTMRAMLALPNYNWRLATLLSIAPIFVLGVVAILTMDESARWVLISHGEADAKQLLRKVALRNGGGNYLAELDRMSLRVPDQAKSGEAAYQMFCTKGLVWRIVAVCVLWFSSGFSFYGLTLGVNALPFDRYYVTAIISTVEIPARALNRPLLASPLGRKYGILLLLSILASASVTAMFWTSDFGRTFLNIGGRAASGAGFIAIYVWSTELLPTSVRQGGMSLGSFSARVGSVVAPWAAEIGELLPIPDDLANDVPLALFGASAIIAGVLALVVLPETRGQSSPETIAEAVIELRSTEQRRDDPAFKIAAALGCAIGLAAGCLVGFVVQAATNNVLLGVGAGIGLALVAVSVVAICYRRVVQAPPNWRELHRSKAKRCCPI